MSIHHFEYLGEILACMNFLNFLGVAFAAVTFMLLTKGLGFNARNCFLVNGLMTAVLATAAFTLLPDFVLRFLNLIRSRILHRAPKD